MELVPAAGRAKLPAPFEPRRQKMKLGVDSVEEDDENHDLADRDREAPARVEDPGQAWPRSRARGSSAGMLEARPEP